jgi:hypothetical protein
MKRTIILMLMILPAALLAQAPALGGLEIGEKLRQNSESLKRYSYKRRTEVRIKDQSRGTRVDLIRYIDGKRETVPLETPPRAEHAGRGGLRGKIVAKKKEEMKEDVERLTAFLQRYSPGSDSMRALVEKASITRTGSGPDSDIKVVARGLVTPSDSFTLVWSIANHRPVKIEIQSELDNKPAKIEIDYSTLPNGPFFPAHTGITAPEKKIVVNIDTFDYALSGAN